MYGWLVEQLTPLGDLKCVGMEYGVEYVTGSSTGAPTMPEWYATNWASQKMVKY